MCDPERYGYVEDGHWNLRKQKRVPDRDPFLYDCDGLSLRRGP